MIIKDKTKLEKKLFLRDPELTELGRNIIDQSIKIIDKFGFEDFTFRKLAVELKSTEASIYRYFENKQRLFLYLITWYWSWVKYNIDFQIIKLRDPKKKLKAIIKVLCSSSQDDPSTAHIDESILCRIVITQSDKTYLTSSIEQDNKDGLFEAKKEVCNKIASVISMINPGYPNPVSLAISIINIVHKQLFYSVFLKDFTDLTISGNDPRQLEAFIENLIFSTLKKA